MISPDNPRFGHTRTDGLLTDLSGFRPSDKFILPPGVNQLDLLEDPQGIFYVQKSLSDREVNHAAIINYLATYEYPAIGFEGNVRGRSIREQATYMQQAAQFDLSVMPVYIDNTTFVYPYREGPRLRDSLQQGNIECILPTLNSLKSAHELELHPGDRHPGNVIVLPDGAVMHIDFEVDAQGKHVKELELAQMIYGILGKTTKIDEATALVRQFAIDQRHRYDWRQVTLFLKNYDNYLTSHDIGKKSKTETPRLQNKLPLITQMLLPQ